MPHVIAHRGLSGRLPEHTLEAYIEAIPFADGFECDVRLTRDQQLVCWHDARLDRTSNLKGRVSTTPWESMRRAEPKPLLFVDLLRLAIESGKDLYVETKHPVRYAGAVERAVARTLSEYQAAITSSGIAVHLMSFSSIAVRRAHALSLSTVHLANNSRIRSAGTAEFVGMAWRQITEQLVEQASQRGQSMLAWTVNDMSAVPVLSSWGVAGIISDHPDLVRAQLN